MDFFNHVRNLAKRVGLAEEADDRQATEKSQAPDWSFVDKFAENIAKRAGTSKDEIWELLYNGKPDNRAPGIRSEDNVEFTQGDIPGSSEKLKRWIMEHTQEFTTLVACLAAGPTAVAITPAVLGLLGFGPLGIVAGAPAALLQSAMGPIAAKSAFAIMTSAGMGGMGLTVVQAIAASGAFGGVCAPAAASFVGAMQEE